MLLDHQEAPSETGKLISGCLSVASTSLPDGLQKQLSGAAWLTSAQWRAAGVASCTNWRTSWPSKTSDSSALNGSDSSSPVLFEVFFSTWGHCVTWGKLHLRQPRLNSLSSSEQTVALLCAEVDFLKIAIVEFDFRRQELICSDL